MPLIFPPVLTPFLLNSFDVIYGWPLMSNDLRPLFTLQHVVFTEFDSIETLSLKKCYLCNQS